MQLGAGASAQFSRDDERKADDHGFRYLLGAGYDPEGLLTSSRKSGSSQPSPAAIWMP